MGKSRKIDTEKILRELIKFRDERDWKQFHSLKNLVCGLNVESAELLEHFIWEDLGEGAALDEAKKREIAKELADVLNYVLLISERLDIDLEEVALEKIRENSEKYPVEKVRGRSDKYNTY